MKARYEILKVNGGLYQMAKLNYTAYGLQAFGDPINGTADDVQRLAMVTDETMAIINSGYRVEALARSQQS